VFVAHAAIRHKGRIYTGSSHAAIMRDVWKHLGRAEKIPQEEQGFVTDAGDFLDRFQAGALAFDAGQTKTRKHSLFSEDVW
jgi:hypothetical protein